MATDAVFADELIEAVLAELTAHLPANWFASTADANETPLALMEHGDLFDYAAPGQGFAVNTPALFVRCMGIAPNDSVSGIAGVQGFAHRMRVVHMRTWEHCHTAAGGAEKNQTKARSRYAKIISKALFNDPYGRMGSPALTTGDTQADVAYVGEPTWDLGGDGRGEVAFLRGLGVHVWAVSCDFDIIVQAGP